MTVALYAASFPMLPFRGDYEGMPGFAGARDEGEPTGEVRKTKIIVIDDEILIAGTVVEILNQAGFEAVAAPNGNSAIALADSWKPDIVLSDVIMPVLNGIETAIKIRDIRPECRVILFSGQAATIDLLEDARQRGHQFEILAKPIKPDQLVAAIRAAARHT